MKRLLPQSLDSSEPPRPSLPSRLSNILIPNTLWTTALYSVPPNFEPGDPLPVEPVYRLDNRKLSRARTGIMTQADPFLWVREDKLYLFVEAEPEVGNGRIDAWVTDDLQRFTSLGTILREPYHLSYPFVFADGERTYMLPESSGGGGVFLYEFEEFPTRLRQRRQLLEGCHVDSSLIRVDHAWYLFTTSKTGLEIHILDDLLLGNVRAHPMNPITDDPRVSRCGGGVFHTRSGLVRVAQDCSSKYGENLNLLAIDKLSATAYSERLVREHFITLDRPWNRLGSHHLSFARFGGGTVVAIDGRQSDYYLHRLRGLVYRALGL